jgi:hypothetical protein
MTMPIMMIEVMRNCLGDSIIRNPPVRIRIETIKYQAQLINAALPRQTSQLC